MWKSIVYILIFNLVIKKYLVKKVIMQTKGSFKVWNLSKNVFFKLIFFYLCNFFYYAALLHHFNTPSLLQKLHQRFLSVFITIMHHVQMIAVKLIAKTIWLKTKCAVRNLQSCYGAGTTIVSIVDTHNTWIRGRQVAKSVWQSLLCYP